MTRAGDLDADVTVVLVHSFASDMRMWHRVVDALPEVAERPVGVLALRPPGAREVLCRDCDGLGGAATGG